MNKIRYAYQRVVYGVDERFKLDIGQYFVENFLNKLEEFVDEHIEEYDNDRKAKFKVMKFFILTYRDKPTQKNLGNVIEFLGKNIYVFWN